MKQCNKCNETLGFDQFNKHRFNKDGLDSTCKKCYSAAQNIKNRLKVGFSMYKPDSCECCGTSDVKLDLDHCHETDKFRGWLCTNCNVGISRLGDNKTGVAKALDYLNKL